MYDDAYTRNDNDELAVRTVSTSGDNGTNKDDVFTRDDEGRLCMRTVGGSGGGGDQHNLGYYATQSALEEAYPTAEAGDWAIVGATDTVWIWDTDNSEWVDSDQKGQVTSVNGQTGAVVLTIPDVVQYSTMPTASADNLGKIVQFTGTTDSNYTHGYIYECVTDDNTTYYWKQLNVQPVSETVKVNTTATLVVADWSSDTQTVTVSGVKADSVVFVSPAPASASDYASAGILCTSQGADSLTFSCTQTPSVAIDVNVICL